MKTDDYEVERLLANLTPTDASIERDGLIYAAGMRDGQMQMHRGRRIWQASALAVSLLAVVAFGLFWIKQPEQQKVANLATEAPSSDETLTKPTNRLQEQPTVAAFSNIFNLDSSNRQELQELGISVTAWDHPWQSEDPPIRWIEVGFDLARVPKSRQVVMTSRFSNDQGELEAAARIESREDQSTLALVTAVPGNQLTRSRMEILIWKETSDGAEAHGYKLSMQRLIELARKPHDK